MKTRRTILILVILVLSVLFVTYLRAQTNSTPSTNNPPPTTDTLTVTNAQSAAAALLHYLCPNISFSGAAILLFWISSHVRSRRPDGTTLFDKLLALLAGDTTKTPPPTKPPTGTDGMLPSPTTKPAP